MDKPAAPLMLPGLSHDDVCKDTIETSTHCTSRRYHCSGTVQTSCSCTCFIHSSIQAAFIHLFHHSFMSLFVCLLIHLFNHRFIHLSIRQFIQPSFHVSIHPFICGCMCTGSSVLGRAKQLGPHSFVHLSLFPANEQLEVALPPLQTPFQAQTFCPEFHFRRQLPLQIDARMVRELATQVERLAACCRHLSLLWASASVRSPHRTTCAC